MRVIAGQARGIPLISPDNQTIRPTLDRVRESLFNILTPYLEGARFLDLFAGTGANGIEALSRGAAQVVFVDSAASALALIEKNLQKTRLSGGRSAQLFLPQDLERMQGAFDIVFADPPYAYPDYEALLNQLHACALLAPEALIVLEHDRKSPLPETLGAYACFRSKGYGTTALSFYRQSSA